MDTESIFFTLFIIWYFSSYITEDTINTFYRLHRQATEFFEFYNSIMYEHLLLNVNDDNTSPSMEPIVEQKPKPKVKYEDKYLEEIRKMNKEYVFDEYEKVEESNHLIELQKKASDERFYQITQICDKMTEIEIKLTKYEDNEGYCICDDDGDINFGETKEERAKSLLKQQIGLFEEKKKLEDLYSSEDYKTDELKKNIDSAKKFIIQKRLNKLENSYVMESTPLGNVLMKYDKYKESFRFYSDITIPYRYLEVVGRKFVKQFNCRPIFVDMEEELQLSQEKWEKETKEKEEKEEEDKRKKEEAIKNKEPIQEKKKNVFTKFKSYNTESGTGRVTTAAPPKNSIPNKKMTKAQENEKILLKQQANRYTHEGKIANFSFIQKIDRKVVDKKFGMSFSDFKKNISKK